MKYDLRLSQIFCRDYLKTLKWYEPLLDAVKRYIKEEGLDLLFAETPELFSIAGYEFKSSVKPYIVNEKVYMKVGFHLLDDDNVLSEKVCVCLYIDKAGVVTFSFKDGYPVRTSLASDDGFEDEAYRFHDEILEPLASQFFESFSK
ncbi:hypothetical protein [Shewanella psychrotolerans]|uniref:hypothetical protein n=1 Tax=Shewanella psychrotolerans TaxID=2864206 RepID=UPI001C65657D|nr:hypothetical protein [Shewanella psychrotolerans]QYK02780.1 hypothetical protein K0I62_07525 [Shewanella psychrotolerans]